MIIPLLSLSFIVDFSYLKQKNENLLEKLEESMVQQKE